MQLLHIFFLLFMIRISEFSTIPVSSGKIGTGIQPGIKKSKVNFSYNNAALAGPDHWPALVPQCGKPNQSPTDIITLEVLDGRRYSIQWNNFGVFNGQLLNNGHAPELQVQRNTVLLSNVPGMPNDVKFTLNNVHIHFGKVLRPGSEHSINAKVYAGEIHLDHYNPEFLSYAEASMGDPESLVTVAILFEVDWTLGYHSSLDLFILRYISQITSPTSPPVKVPVKLSDFLPSSGDFFTYVGSKTVPPCTPNVRWIVAEKPIKISPAALFTLYLLKDSKDTPISKFGNSRPAQPIGRRIVEANFKRAVVNTGRFLG